MSIVKYFHRLKANKYYSTSELYAYYTSEKDLIVFLLDVHNILEHILKTKNIWLRYRDQKELLKVLKFVFTHYRLYLIDSPALQWPFYTNRFHSHPVGIREECICILIYELSQSIGNPEDIYKQRVIDYIRQYKKESIVNERYDGEWKEEVTWWYIWGRVDIAYPYEYLSGKL